MAWDADIIDDRVKDQYDSKKNNKNKQECCSHS